MTGLKSIIAAGGLALAAAAAAAAPANTAAPAVTAAPAGAVTVGASGGSAAATTPAATAAPQGAGPSAVQGPGLPVPGTPADPTLAADGTQLVRPTAHVGQPSDGYLGIQPQVTANGQMGHWFHDTILVPLIVLISLFVLLLLVYVVVRFRASANPTPSKTSHNTVIEIVWTLVPVLILVAIAVPSIRLLAAQFTPPPKGAVTLKATGNQWYWTYEYPDHGGVAITANMLKERGEVPAGQRFRTDADGPRMLAADNRIVLPVGVPIRLLTTAADVIHSWAVPAFWIKLDAVPGRINETSFTIEKPGVYFGQCSELCGARHAYMPIAVEAVSPAQFAAWIAAKGGKMPGAAAAGTGVPQLKPGTLPSTSPNTGAEFAPPPGNATTPAVVNGTAPVNARATGNTGTLSSPSGR